MAGMEGGTKLQRGQLSSRRGAMAYVVCRHAGKLPARKDLASARPSLAELKPSLGKLPSPPGGLGRK